MDHPTLMRKLLDFHHPTQNLKYLVHSILLPLYHQNQTISTILSSWYNKSKQNTVKNEICIIFTAQNSLNKKQTNKK